MTSLPLLVLVLLGVAVRSAWGSWRNPPLRDTGPLAQIFTGFTGTDHLGTPHGSVRYVYLIMRHGMVAPSPETYPSDWHFKSKWKEIDRFTTHGKRMMTKLGRSLATRYKDFMEKATADGIKVTTMSTGYGMQNADELLKGLLPEKLRPPIQSSKADKFRLLKSPEDCKAYENLKAAVMENKRHSPEELQFFTYLRRKIGEKEKKDSKWYINSRERVYGLWEIMDFERKSKQWSPLWCGDGCREHMRKIVNIYLKDTITGNMKMAKYVAEWMFDEILEEIEKNEVKMHIHVTNDFTYAAFKSLLMDCGVTAPEFGETLMVEVDTSGIVNVHSYRPYRKSDNYDRDLKFGGGKIMRFLESIKEQLRSKYDFNDKLNKERWGQLCRGEPLTSTPSRSFNREGREMWPSPTTERSPSRDLQTLPNAESVAPMSPLTSKSGRHSETGVVVSLMIAPASPGSASNHDLPQSSQSPEKQLIPADLLNMSFRKEDIAKHVVERTYHDGTVETEKTSVRVVHSDRDRMPVPRDDEAFRQTVVVKTAQGEIAHSTAVKYTHV